MDPILDDEFWSELASHVEHTPFGPRITQDPIAPAAFEPDEGDLVTVRYVAAPTPLAPDAVFAAPGLDAVTMDGAAGGWSIEGTSGGDLLVGDGAMRHAGSDASLSAAALPDATLFSEGALGTMPPPDEPPMLDGGA